MNQEIVTKKCSKCQEVKPINEFHKDRYGKYGYSGRCKLCQQKRRKLYYNKNQEKAKNDAKIAYHKNPLLFKNYSKNYRLNNPELIAIQQYNWRKDHPNYQKLYENNKRKTDPIYRLMRIHRGRIRSTLKHSKKYYKSITLLGCTKQENLQHIEYQFYNNMTWKDQGVGHGKWQIHHICPLEFFDMTDPIEQKQAWHYTNTQPLWYEDHCEIHRKINERMSQYENGGKPH